MACRASRKRPGGVWGVVALLPGSPISFVEASRFPRRAAVGVFFLVETGFLLWAGAPLWSSSPSSFTATPAEALLQQIVGNARVGLGWCPVRHCLVYDLGILPDANVAYLVAEFAAYEPIMPTSPTSDPGPRSPIGLRSPKRLTRSVSSVRR